MKKFISFFVLICFVFSAVNISAMPIHKYEEVIPISKSITLTKVREFYAGHNISYSHIKADLNDENVSLKLLKSDKGADILETVPNLAKGESGIVAAMNADFFSVHSGNKGFSLGIEIQNGNMLQSPIYPETMATISYTDSAIDMGYLSFLFAAVAPNGNFNTIRHLNKHTTYFGDILMYTSEWNGGYSPAPGGDVLEVVVDGGKVCEMRRNMPSVKIPENGCVLVVSEGSNMFFANNFQIGDDIRFDYYITPDIQKAEAAFGGGAMLVQDGNIVKTFSHVISGYNPRSAIGMSKDGKTLHMVALDGRQTSSRGMTMSELATLMSELGCYNAVNLDGGGSTNMVSSNIWNKDLTSANSPTENRKVINAVGLSFNAPKGTPLGIEVKPKADTIFIGDSVAVDTAIYDENMRPLEGVVDLSSPNGSFEYSVFTAEKGGKAVIEAKSSSATGYGSIYVIDKISGIDTISHMPLKKGETKSFTINVFDSEGHFATASNTSPFKITSSDTSVVSVNGTNLTGLKDGTATVSIEKDGVKTNISVAVGSKSYNYTETFEYKEGSFMAYPDDVPGAFELSSKNAHSGAFSGYLSFDFSADTDTTKAVYYNLTKKNTLKDSSDIKISVMTENTFNHDLRAQFIGADGNVYRAVLGRDLENGKWHTLSCKVPEDAPKPVRLDKIYAVYVDGEQKDSGGIYLDDLTYEMTEDLSFESSPENIYSDFEDGESSAPSFRVGALVKNPATLLSGLTNSKINSSVTANSSNAVIGALKPFSKKEDANALYISINTSKGGIRATDSSQWNSIANAIYETKKDNVFILSDYSIFGSNQFENSVIMDYFAKLSKNIFVITGGDSNSYKNIYGVKYFTLNNSEKEALSEQRMKNYKYLEFYFGSEVSFKWKNVF